MFGKGIGNVVGSQNFDQREVLGTEPILYPKISGGEMADFAKSASPANSHRRCRIRLNNHVQLNPRSAATDLRPMELEAPRVIPPSSASALDNVTVV